MRRTSATKTCPTCGGHFWCKASHARKVTYCSRPCMAAGYRTRMRGRGNPNYSDGGRRTCEKCGGQFATHKKQRFCSLRCRDDACRHLGAHTKDGNHDEIAAALRGAGVHVVDLSEVGGGVPDLLAVTERGVFLLEVKNPATTYGRRGLSPVQTRWHASWRGQSAVVRTVEDALAAVGLLASVAA